MPKCNGILRRPIFKKKPKPNNIKKNIKLILEEYKSELASIKNNPHRNVNNGSNFIITNFAKIMYDRTLFMNTNIVIILKENKQIFCAITCIGGVQHFYYEVEGERDVDDDNDDDCENDDDDEDVDSEDGSEDDNADDEGEEGDDEGDDFDDSSDDDDGYISDFDYAAEEAANVEADGSKDNI